MATKFGNVAFITRDNSFSANVLVPTFRQQDWEDTANKFRLF